MVTELSTQLLGLYVHYKNGFLPFAGGLLSQPNPFIEAMPIIENAINDD